ncbi:MAG TPA: thiolase family protein [Hyphomicrobiaceae bacterium]|nr:thiolase family protein [Hyphomicrobiaceae bacterium]
MSATPSASAYIIAARRSALGRLGGLHRNRRLEELTAPVIAAVLADAKLAPDSVDEIVIGNASAGGNPARIIALAAGLPETAPALTIDRQCGSGLDAILTAIRTVTAGDAEVILAGGAESLSTAPWRIAKPRSLYQLPHFIGIDAHAETASEEPVAYEASEALARRLRISRREQDAFALKSHLKAESAREARRFVGEIVAIRANAEEARDQSAIGPSLEDIEREQPFVQPGGTLTPANTSLPHDGAAIVVVVSERIWQELGKPRALRLLAGAAQGVAPESEADAPIAAMQRLYARLNGFDRTAVSVVEMSEASAAQALALVRSLGIEEDVLNPDGGAIVRGHPLGASGAVLVVRLFSRLARNRAGGGGVYGIATQGAIGGLGLAALFEAV